MSDKSDDSGDDLFEYEKGTPEKSPAVGKDDEGDEEIGLRDEDPEHDNKKDPYAEGPKDEDLDDAGYGGEDALGNEEIEDTKGDVGAYGEEEEENIGEIQYAKDEAEDEEEFEYGSDSGRRKKKKRGDKEKRSGSRRKKVKHEEAEEDPDAEDEERQEKKKSKKRREEEPDENLVGDLASRMMEAYDDDIDAIRQKRPALNKLKLLPEVEKILRRGVNQRHFLDRHEGLEVIRRWLSKPANGAPPSLQIKKTLVDILYQLPITDEHLKSSEIGKVVFNMKNNPSENPELRKQLKDVIDKWTRVVTDPNDYGSDEEDFRDRKKVSISLDDYRQQSMSSLRKSIPRMVNKRSGYDFVRRPPTEGGTRNLSSRQQANEECDKLIKEMKRKMKKAF